jgi:hypothetical protein
MATRLGLRLLYPLALLFPLLSALLYPLALA